MLREPFAIQWIDANKEPQCEPNPAFPDGVDVDLSMGAQRVCTARLPYPADRIGAYIVRCNTCGASAGCTTAGRPDDPRSLTMACEERPN